MSEEEVSMSEVPQEGDGEEAASAAQAAPPEGEDLSPSTGEEGGIEQTNDMLNGAEGGAAEAGIMEGAQEEALGAEEQEQQAVVEAGLDVDANLGMDVDVNFQLGGDAGDGQAPMADDNGSGALPEAGEAPAADGAYYDNAGYGDGVGDSYAQEGAADVYGQEYMMGGAGGPEAGYGIQEDSVGQAYAEARGPGGDAQASDAQAMVTQLAEEREAHEAAMKVEAKAREELEDMILRIEKHFKAEQAARKKAEEMLQASIAGELDAKSKAEEVMKKRAQEQRLLDEERAAVKRERVALESMRKEFEAELHAARSEVAKAQEALAASEERIRATEQLERARLEADYQGRLASMGQEVDRMRDELGYRTAVMGQEMEKWRQQAAMTANAVLEAKNEVLERKKELDSTKDKMDRLLDKLYVGRERGIELSGAIASNQRMLSYMPGGIFLNNSNNTRTGGGATQHPQAGTILPPIKQAQTQAAGVPWGANGTLMYEATDAPPAGGGAGRNASMRKAASTHNLITQPQHSYDYHGAPGQLNSTSRSDGQTLEAAPAQYGHVQSKFSRDAAGKADAGKAARQRVAAKAKNAKPDRFAEAEREKGRLAGMMGSRWN